MTPNYNTVQEELQYLGIKYIPNKAPSSTHPNAEYFDKVEYQILSQINIESYRSSENLPSHIYSEAYEQTLADKISRSLQNKPKYIQLNAYWRWMATACVAIALFFILPIKNEPSHNNEFDWSWLDDQDVHNYLIHSMTAQEFNQIATESVLNESSLDLLEWELSHQEIDYLQDNKSWFEVVL